MEFTCPNDLETGLHVIGLHEAAYLIIGWKVVRMCVGNSWEMQVSASHCNL